MKYITMGDLVIKLKELNPNVTMRLGITNVRKWEDNPEQVYIKLGKNVTVKDSLNALNRAFLKSHSGDYDNSKAFDESTVAHFDSADHHSGHGAFHYANVLKTLATGERNNFEGNIVERVEMAKTEQVEDGALRKEIYNELFNIMFSEINLTIEENYE